MNVGFDTIGNATLICYDGRPVLATDPWIAGTPYFGSWALSHAIPPEQMEAIHRADFLWISHGHPDHLSDESLAMLSGKTILLPDHVGSRIHAGLEGRGFQVRVLADKAWTRLSDRVRVMCLADYNQDATLLVDLNGRLVVNMNDGGVRGWRGLVRRTIRRYPVSFYLHLYGGEADMLNFFDEDGRRLPHDSKKGRVGRMIAYDTEQLGATHFIPFSSFHQMHRTDSVWIQPYVCGPEDFAAGFESTRCRMLPAFVRYDCETDVWAALDPEPLASVVQPPGAFGDHWGDRLDADEAATVAAYFRSIAHLGDFLDFIRLRVGGAEHVIELARKRFDRGVTFEVPRQSLVTAVAYEVFDDLLIGNFMKTTLHGPWPRERLQKQFTPYVAKYADNGRARTRAELDAYFRAYRSRLGAAEVLDRFVDGLERRSKNIFRDHVSRESWMYRGARRAYWALRARR